MEGEYNTEEGGSETQIDQANPARVIICSRFQSVSFMENQPRDTERGCHANPQFHYVLNSCCSTFMKTDRYSRITCTIVGGQNIKDSIFAFTAT